MSINLIQLSPNYAGSIDVITGNTFLITIFYVNHSKLKSCYLNLILSITFCYSKLYLNSYTQQQLQVYHKTKSECGKNYIWKKIRKSSQNPATNWICRTVLYSGQEQCESRHVCLPHAYLYEQRKKCWSCTEYQWLSVNLCFLKRRFLLTLWWRE